MNVPRRLASLAGALLVMAPAIGMGSVVPAAAVDPVMLIDPVMRPKLESIRADIRVETNGSLRVKETESFDFGAKGVTSTHRRFATRLHYDADYDRVLEVSGMSAKLGGKTLKVGEAEDNGVTTFTIDFGQYPRGKQDLILEYSVGGTVRSTADGPELNWPAIQGLDWPAKDVTLTAVTPALTWAACTAGRLGSAMPCTSTQLGELTRPRFDQAGLEADERLTLMLGMPSTAGVSADQDLVRRWSLGSAFALSPWSIGLALGLILIAALAIFVLWRTRGRDVEATRSLGKKEPYDGSTPPDEVRPGQLGTVVDERADVVDLVATVLDLAVRGHVTIESVTDGEGPPSWRLRRGRAVEHSRYREGELLPYEKNLLDLLLPSGQDSVVLTDLSDEFASGLGAMTEHLYADVVSQGWFAERPDAARGRWTSAGIALAVAGVVLTVVLAATTELGLVGLGFMLAGMVLAWGGEVAPARTARGSALLAKLHVFREHLSTVDVAALPAVEAERLLPYAVVFGLESRWQGVVSESSTLPSALESFIGALSGAISSARRLRI